MKTKCKIESFWWLITKKHILKLVAEKIELNEQMRSDRQQGGVHIGDCGASGVEFVANKLVIKEGSDCCGKWGAVCVTKRQWWNGAGEELML